MSSPICDQRADKCLRVVVDEPEDDSSMIMVVVTDFVACHDRPQELHG